MLSSHLSNIFWTLVNHAEGSEGCQGTSILAILGKNDCPLSIPLLLSFFHLFLFLLRLWPIFDHMNCLLPELTALSSLPPPKPISDELSVGGGVA